MIVGQNSKKVDEFLISFLLGKKKSPLGFYA